MTVVEPERPDKSAARWALDIAGYILAVAGLAYGGANSVVPGLAGAAAFGIFEKLKFGRSTFARLAIALQSGYVVWLWVGAVFAHFPTAFTVEVAIFTAVLALFAWRQVKWVAVVLTAYHALGFLIEVDRILAFPFDSAPSHALATHIILRAAITVTLAFFLREKPKEDLVSAF